MNKPKINPKIFSMILLLAIVASTVLIAQPASAATIDTCDSNGTAKSTFNSGENVYFTASDLDPSFSYPIYVVIKNESWTTGMVFPVRYYNTVPSVTTDDLGNIDPINIYTKITCGEYYVAVDVDGNGIYDEETDLLITNLVVTLEVTTKTSGGAPISTVFLTPTELYAMPSYTGVGCPRRSGGYYPPEQIGNYTGVPLMCLCNIVGGINSTSSIAISTDVDTYTTNLGYTYVHDNSYTQYNISTGAVIYGQQPIMILAYKVNGTMLSSDGTGLGGNTDLGGPLRLLVVSNNGTSPILVNDGMSTFGNTYVKAVTKIVITVPASLTYNTSDNSGTAKSTFNRNETVYFVATGFSASTTYPIYVVNHVSAWAVRVAIPARVSGSASSVTSNALGNIVASSNSIYAGSQAGSYDVIVDLNSNGIYDETDLLIYNVAGAYGFSVS